MNKLLSEFLGTFILVFAGTGAIIINEVSGGVIGHAGVALTFGLVVMAMIYTFGDVSVAHLNPAVTLAFAAARRFAWKDVSGFLAAQIGGACLASGVWRLLFPTDDKLGATLPAGGAMQSFVLEVILTAILMLTIPRTPRARTKKSSTCSVGFATRSKPFHRVCGRATRSDGGPVSVREQ